MFVFDDLFELSDYFFGSRFLKTLFWLLEDIGIEQELDGVVAYVIIT